MAGQILPDDDHRQPGGGHVLLRAGVDDAEFGQVHRAGENVRGHITHQGHSARLRNVLPLGAVNGVIGAVVEVAGLRVQLQLLLGGDVGVVPVPGVGGDVHHAVLFGLLHGDGGEVACNGVIRLPGAAHQVQRDHGELAGGAGLEQKDPIAVGHPHQAAQLFLGLLKNPQKDL